MFFAASKSSHVISVPRINLERGIANVMMMLSQLHGINANALFYFKIQGWDAPGCPHECTMTKCAFPRKRDTMMRRAR